MPLPVEQKLDLAVEHIEDLVEILMLVRDLKPTSGRQLALNDTYLSTQRSPDLDRRAAQAEVDRGTRAGR